MYKTTHFYSNHAYLKASDLNTDLKKAIEAAKNADKIVSIHCTCKSNSWITAKFTIAIMSDIFTSKGNLKSHYRHILHGFLGGGYNIEINTIPWS